MNGNLKKHKNSIKFFWIIFCFIIFFGKILYDFSPLFFLKNALGNTINKHKADFTELFEETDRIRMELSFKTNNGDKKTIYTFFDNSVFGFSLTGPDSIYYTLPFDKIKNTLNMDSLYTLSLPSKFSTKNSKALSIIPPLLGLGLNKNITLSFPANAFLKIGIINHSGSYLSKEKTFSFIIPSKSMADMIGLSFDTENDLHKSIKKSLIDLIYIKGGNYLFDIKMSGNTIENIKCITPTKNNTSYCIQINFDYPKLYLKVENLVNQNKECVLSLQTNINKTKNYKAPKFSVKNKISVKEKEPIVFTLISESSKKQNGYTEKNLYSLTVGELFEIVEDLAAG